MALFRRPPDSAIAELVPPDPGAAILPPAPADDGAPAAGQAGPQPNVHQRVLLTADATPVFVAAAREIKRLSEEVRGQRAEKMQSGREGAAPLRRLPSPPPTPADDSAQVSPDPSERPFPSSPQAASSREEQSRLVSLELSVSVLALLARRWAERRGARLLARALKASGAAPSQDDRAMAAEEAVKKARAPRSACPSAAAAPRTERSTLPAASAARAERLPTTAASAPRAERPSSRRHRCRRRAHATPTPVPLPPDRLASAHRPRPLAARRGFPRSARVAG